MIGQANQHRFGNGLVWVPAAVVAVVAAAGYWPTRRLAGLAGVEAMLVAQGVVIGVVYATMLPAMRRMSAATNAPERFKAAFRAGTERMILTVAVAGAIAWQTSIETKPFLAWVAISYVVMIKVETLILIRWSKRLESA